jgi:hypothetical protein
MTDSQSSQVTPDTPVRACGQITSTQRKRGPAYGPWDV